MRTWLPYPGKQVLLASCALALRRGQALGPTLRRLASEDRSLAPWIPRLVPALEAGQPLIPLLRDWRVISADEQRLLDQAEGHGALAAVLPGIAQARVNAVPRLWLWQWFPTWAALALVAGAVYIHLLIEFISGNPFRIIFTELAIDLPPISSMAMSAPPLFALLAASVPVVLIGGGQYLLRCLPWSGCLRVLRGVHLERARLVCELLQWGRLAEQAHNHGAHIPDHYWRWSWRWYHFAMALGRHRHALSTTLLDHLDQHDLVGRLLAIGLIHRDAQGIHWDSAIAIAQRELLHTYARIRVTILLLLIATILSTFLMVFTLPIIEIINQIH